jgi:ABC-type transport system involved in multi-copper enzyme maturation permease subunit
MLNLYRLKELTLFDFCYSLVNLKSLAFIIPYFLFWYLIFNNFSQAAVEWIQSAQGIFAASYFLEDQELVINMFIDRSATLSLYLLLSTTITPLFILLAANNQYSSDASRGSFRFILTRATHLELYLSRFIAVTLLVLICLSITTVWASIIAVLNNEAESKNIFIYSLETFLMLGFYSLPFIAFMSAISSLARSAFSCLFLGMMTYVLLLLLAFIFKDDFIYSIYLLPSAIKPLLTDINSQNIMISVSSLICYTLIYFGFGWLIFKRRDM